jgi:hypothetical protein
MELDGLLITGFVALAIGLYDCLLVGGELTLEHRVFVVMTTS